MLCPKIDKDKNIRNKYIDKNILTSEDMDTLISIANRRCERAENAVISDFFAQHGIKEGMEFEQARQEYYKRKTEISENITTAYPSDDIQLQNAYLRGQCAAFKYCFERITKE